MPIDTHWQVQLATQQISLEVCEIWAPRVKSRLELGKSSSNLPSRKKAHQLTNLKYAEINCLPKSKAKHYIMVPTNR
jgi:hypothetical protein